jgi:hypothetical protein
MTFLTNEHSGSRFSAAVRLKGELCRCRPSRLQHVLSPPRRAKACNRKETNPCLQHILEFYDTAIEAQ